AMLAARRVLRRPVAAIEARAEHAVAGADEPEAPAEPEDAPEPTDADLSATARVEAGETEPRPRMRARDRFAGAFSRFAFELIPVAAFALAGHISAATPLGGAAVPRLIAETAIDAAALWQAIRALTRLLTAPGHPGLRLLRMSEASAAWTTRWVLRIALVAVAAYAIGQTGMLLGMAREAYDGIQKIAGLINHLFVATMILQSRRRVRAWLRGPEGTSGGLMRLRAAIAPWWHWIVLALLGGEWLVWAAELRHGYTAMAYTVGVAVLVAAGTRLALVESRAALARALRPGAELAERYPGLEARLALYHPILRGVLLAAVLALGAAVLLELLDIGVFAWITGTTLGQRLLGGIGTIGATVVLALLVWELGNASLHRQAARLAGDGHLARAARMRTLLPLLRTTLSVGVGAVAGLTVLSEIGINIAPLLAGAGIIGVAIGFGSQKLVQDLITGIFLLLENAMQVGDWVSLSGLSGTVENLSVRTIRLRAADGSVHIIPFSAVTSVTNTNRGLGNAAVAVTLAASEDTDRAGTELKAIAAELRKDPAFAGMMLSDLQLWGVDKMDGAAVTLAGQIPCTDTGRWPVQREFNRRVRLRFQELGIALWNPAQTMLLSSPAPEPGARARAAE
ncbi:MAG: mechanosensitive ion channel, partial [Rhodospirillales bacterium]|nr:mechanosensitive ion channel [Rhodospirillales bacterium]